MMRGSELALFAFLLVAGGCTPDRPGEPVSQRPAPAPAAPAPEAGPFRFPAADRVVAFGDVHGDLSGVRKVLRLAGAIDDKDEWIGGKLVVVQTGDQLDRGDEEPEVLQLFEKLREGAAKAGGSFHALNGNHEVMNVAGDYRYVTDDGFADYGKTPLIGSRGKAAVLLPEPQRGRAAAFLPGGPVAVKLSKQPLIIVVGDTVFAHGGVLPSHVRYGVARINDEAASWMRGETQRLPPILDGNTAPVWARDYSDGQPSERACNALGTALDLLGARRMVVGHTVQKDGISSACSERVWRIDVGLAKHYGGRAAALEIRQGKARVLTEAEREPAAPASGAAPKKPSPAAKQPISAAP